MSVVAATLEAGAVEPGHHHPVLPEDPAVDQSVPANLVIGLDSERSQTLTRVRVDAYGAPAQRVEGCMLPDVSASLYGPQSWSYWTRSDGRLAFQNTRLPRKKACVMASPSGSADSRQFRRQMGSATLGQTIEPEKFIGLLPGIRPSPEPARRKGQPKHETSDDARLLCRSERLRVDGGRADRWGPRE